MSNNDVTATWKYHNGTKHPNGNLLSPGHRYNFQTDYPDTFKEYTGLEKIKLSLDTTSLGVPALNTLKNDTSAIDKQILPDLSMLARILFFSAGLTKKYDFPNGRELFMRAASCTGALYHIEIYIICDDLHNLAAGIYHFDPKRLHLSRLQKGNFKNKLLAATANHKNIVQAPITLIFTDMYKRNAVKYQAREYRHAFWDCGTILANTLAICQAHQLPISIITGFVDSAINTLLQLDVSQEFSLVLATIGYQQQDIQDITSLEEQNLLQNSKKFDRKKVSIPAIFDMVEASSLQYADEVTVWLTKSPPKSPSVIKGISIQPFSQSQLSSASIEQVIIRRGSTRSFSRKSISFEELSTIFHVTYQTNPLHYLTDANPAFLTQAYFIVLDVDGLDPGSYVYDPQRKECILLQSGNFRTNAKYLSLGQDLAGDASVTIFFLASLEQILEQFGNRGYRLTQLEGSIVGGRFYLGAYAQNFGATGLTYYDDAVINFFSPHAANKIVTFMISLGHRVQGKHHPGKLSYLHHVD